MYASEIKTQETLQNKCTQHNKKTITQSDAKKAATVQT